MDCVPRQILQALRPDLNGAAMQMHRAVDTFQAKQQQDSVAEGVDLVCLVDELTDARAASTPVRCQCDESLGTEQQQ